MSKAHDNSEKLGLSPYIYWTSAEDQQEAFDKTGGNIDSYDGIMSANASRRSYIDIEPNISVRTDFLKDDYYRFRPFEEPGNNFKQSISMCMKAYDKVGIIRNVIDLMGDFGSQGITLYHKNKKIEKFYRKWWDKVGGTERSERFLNMLYRCGNVIIHKRYGKITRKIQTNMSKANDLLEIKETKVQKRILPFKYDFLNPLSIEVEGGYAGAFTGNKVYKMKLSSSIKKAFRENKKYVDKLPDAVKQAIKDNKHHIILDQDCVEAFFYKKDDWSLWANPMVNAILDDIIMLEKMKLADMSALDGAISNIRLWRLGNLEHKILPNKGAIDKLRNILASNVGGGTMDLVWGPEIDFKESATQIYKFLGTEKYQPVLNSIYAGLGIPPTLTGLAGQSGGFTNNFISLKTLIERLEYGRDLLQQFWVKEIEYVQKAMGFNEPATIHFDHMILSDEAAEKNLLIQLADRDVISLETLRDRFGEINDIEDTRVKKEARRRSNSQLPPKADPYHNGNIENEYTKIALQKGDISIEDVTKIKPSKPEVVEEKPDPEPQEENTEVVEEGGRPKFSVDTKPRKQRRVLPTTNPGTASLIIWSQEAQKQIANILNPALLAHYKKKNLRALSRAEVTDVEDIKFKVLCALEPYEEIHTDKIVSILEKKPQLSKKQKDVKNSIYAEFLEHNGRSPSLDELRNINNIAYSFIFLDKKVT
jgi:hypothetical protein